MPWAQPERPLWFRVMAIRFGRYETLEALAVGGMAKVFRGRALGEAGFERSVAIKVMHGHIAVDPDFVNMFLDEARMAAAINHPNVVSTYDVQRSPSGIFLVMELVDGVDLALLLKALAKRDQRLPVPLSVRIVLETLKGLQAAHELRGSRNEPLNLVHRDVSPQNILLDRRGFVKITDFGVAHATERLATTRGGELKGKMGYLAPEHVREGRVDARSDVYATGVVLWEMLTGKRLFKTDERVTVLADIMAGNVTSPKTWVDTLPDPIAAVCLKALALDPEARFESAKAFASALRRAAQESQLELAEADDLAEAIAQSTALELARANRAVLNQEASLGTDEVTVLDRALSPPSRQKPKAAKLKLGLAFALGVSVGLLGLSYALFTPKSGESLFEAASDPVVGLQVTALPSLPEAPSSEGQPERARASDSATPEGAPAPHRKSRAPAPSSTMYHPSGL